MKIIFPLGHVGKTKTKKMKRFSTKSVGLKRLIRLIMINHDSCMDMINHNHTQLSMINHD